MSAWKLKRTRQCAACPWKKSTDPRADIPGYSEQQHRELAGTIAEPDNIGQALAQMNGKEPMQVFTCHDTKDAHCVGWLAHQLGPGNNIMLRMQMRDCENADRIRTVGEQHDRFEDTLP
jgi:hypothetical protein